MRYAAPLSVCAIFTLPDAEPAHRAKRTRLVFGVKQRHRALVGSCGVILTLKDKD
jgi:hypothetical protein